ncbi:alanyl-tRNA editing protein [Sutcliffiella sp. NC1]|uniref:alanyl-tRNA editing protein n=1 Tax=Sutcliffiella sp. NC1 TaxID=3004096 RepID=UPI0022DE2104|nr:DHHA1 domain-containing protein [Sutcliffiella sp. NC1]WBL13071.1 DHHA1 domain-containing protein [Sutcliffiella sp. NC1]
MNKLYYIDQYKQSFSTRVIKQVSENDKETYVVLEETAFYPTGGGQPNDIGYIQNVPIINVEIIDNEIRHYLKEPLKDEIVQAQIDWERRWDHMQQHSGQHILSAAFAQLFQYETVSFHLGQETCTIDIQTESVTNEELFQAETLANEIILANKPISTKWITASEVELYPLRKKPSVQENIRLVIIPDFDYNACGGTHPATTSEVGMIKILHTEKQKKNVRITCICGERVRKQFHLKHETISSLSQLLNAPETRIIDSASQLLTKLKESEKEIERLKEEIIAYEVERLIDIRAYVGPFHTISSVLPNLSMKELQKLAKILLQKSTNTIVILVSSIEDKLQIVCGRTEEPQHKMNQLLSTVLPLISGKGGGSEAFAQGGGDLSYSPDEIMTKLLNELNISIGTK